MNLLPVLRTLAALCLTHAACAAPAEAPRPLIIDSAAESPHDRWGFNAEIGGSVCGIQTFDALDPSLLPAHSKERRWADQALADVRRKVASVKARGQLAFVATDIFVFPKALVTRYRGEICDDRGRIDIKKPKTRELFALLLQETIDKVPDLDGIVIRTGEVYLHKQPHHVASGNFSDDKRQGGTAIIDGPASHIEILKILREEVCVKRGKSILYRTWSFGPKSFHEDPDYYLKVTQAIDPHPLLLFSVKHQKGDFHQLTPFNPTLMIGRHRQIVEVQSQREAYGKGAHPYYIGAGVIDGWEEYQWMMKPGQARGLRDIIHHPLFAGVWTWSRGGGWEGPTIRNGLWCELNTYAIAQFTADPRLSEANILLRFAREELELSETDAAAFRQLCLLSAKAVLRGQLTTLGAKIDVWWARDHFFEAPDLSDFDKQGLRSKALAEKAEAVALWNEILRIAQTIHFPNPQTAAFVRTSADYGRIKYAIIEQAWLILFTTNDARAGIPIDPAALLKALSQYDALWTQWQNLERQHPECATLYKTTGFEGRPGLGHAIHQARKLANSPAGTPKR